MSVDYAFKEEQSSIEQKKVFWELAPRPEGGESTPGELLTLTLVVCVSGDRSEPESHLLSDSLYV